MGLKRTSSSSTPSSSSASKAKESGKVKKAKGGERSAKKAKITSMVGNAQHEEHRFKFQTFAQKLENISLEHFQKRAGFVGLKPAEHSSWFYASVLAWRDSNLTSAFGALCSELEKFMRSGTVAQVLLVKDELVLALLKAMEKDKGSKSATVVFTHLLAMLGKDLGEELFADHFISIWKTLCGALVDCEEAEVSEAVINCQMFYIRRFGHLLIQDVPRYSQVFLEGLLETTNSALRRTAANTLAYYFCKCPLDQVTAYLQEVEWNTKKVQAVGEALVLGASKQVELIKASFSNADLAMYVCIKVLLNATELEAFWGVFLNECQPSLPLLIKCVALRRGCKVKLHSSILQKISGDSDSSLLVEKALLLALLIKSCDLSTLLTMRKAVQEKLDLVNRNALALFLEALGFELWPAFSGIKFSVDSWVSVEADCLVKQPLCIEGDSFEKRLLRGLLNKEESGIVEELIEKRNPAAIIHFQGSLPREYLLLALSSGNSAVVERALMRLESPLAKLLLAITQIPANLERYREKINAVTALEKELEHLGESEYEELFWFLLGACHIKLSLVMPAVSKLMNQASARKPKLWSSVYSLYIKYVSDKAREEEMYDVQVAPSVSKENKDRTVVMDDNLEKLPTLLKRVQVIVSQADVQFGEIFTKYFPNLNYSMVQPALFGNVLKVLVNASTACSPLDMNNLLSAGNYNAAFVKSMQSHFVDLLSAYGKSSHVRKEHLMSLVAMGDDQIQLKALECLSSATSEYSPLIDLLKPLLSENSWREHLAILTLQRNELLFSNYQWSTMLRELTVRVLYGRLIARRLAKNKGAMQVKRKAILGFVATWPSADMDFFVAFTRTFLQDQSSESFVIMGYLSLLEYVIRYLPLTNVCVEGTFDAVLNLMTAHSSDRRVRSLGMKRLLELLLKPEAAVDEERLKGLLYFLKPMIERLSTEYMQNESSLLDLLALLTKDERYSQVFSNQLIADSLVKCLGVNPRNKIFFKVLLVLETVLPSTSLKQVLLDGLMRKVQMFAGLLSKSTQAIFSQLVRLIMLMAQEQRASIEDVSALKRALLPLLKLKKVPIGVKCDVCRAVSGLFGDSTEQADEYFKVICALIVSNTDIKLRCALIELVGALSIQRVGFSKCFILLQELFSMMPGMLEEADYDRRFRCFSDIRTGQFPLDEPSASLLPYVCLYYVLNEPTELSMRNQSMLYLSENIVHIVDLYLEYLPIAFKSEHEVVRLDYCSLLGKAVPVSERLKDLEGMLHGGDEEAEVFGNLAHLQQHRKIRAIRRLCNGMPKGHFMAAHFVTFMLSWAIPLPNTPSNPALQQEAAKAVGELCGKCSIRQVQQRLDQLLLLIDKEKEREKTVLKVVPYILEHMPLGEGLDALLPKLMNLMRQKGNSTELVRIPIAISLAQLLVRLRKTGEYLPAILSALITSLKSKLEDTRREAREALQSVFKIISSNNKKASDDIDESTLTNQRSTNVVIDDVVIGELVEGFIREMRAVMEPGYQRHVMIFTLNHILTPLVLSNALQLNCTDSDSLFELIMDCLEEDLFGRLAKERETSEWTGKVLEAKSCRGFDLLGALGRTVSDGRLARIHERFRPLGQRNTKNLEKLLNVWLNALDRVELLPFVIDLANPNYYHQTRDSESFNEDAKWQLLGVKSSFLLIKRVSSDVGVQNDYMNVSIKLKSICFGHLYGTHSSLMIASLRFICYSLKWSTESDIDESSMIESKRGLWSEEEKRQVLLRCFELIVRSAGNGELVSECFKYVSHIVRDHADVRVTDQQLKALLTHTRVHLEDLERQQLTFSLLKSVLSRAVSTEHYSLELYELMSDVGRSMVTSHHAVTRQHCRYLMVQFLAECPLSEQKFDEHLDRILSDSANYIHLTGRNSCRELLVLLLKRKLINDELVQRLFLTLTGSYAQETETDGLQMIDAVIKELAGEKKNHLSLMCEMVRKWLESGKTGIVQAATRALNVLNEVTQGKGLAKDLLKHL